MSWLGLGVPKLGRMSWNHKVVVLGKRATIADIALEEDGFSPILLDV